MSGARRLPVYLVLDTSGSMSGEPIEAVRSGIRALLADLRSDPKALESAYLSIITFASTAQQLVPLTELMTFQEPTLDANGGTDMGAGLRLLIQCIDTEVRKNAPDQQQKGDYQPLVFLMTDGQPGDSTWQAAAAELKTKKPANIIALAAGSGADEIMLKSITETVVKLETLTPDALKAFFKWVSRSIKVTSSGLNQPQGAAVNLPPLPQQIQIVP